MLKLSFFNAFRESPLMIFGKKNTIMKKRLVSHLLWRESISENYFNKGSLETNHLHGGNGKALRCASHRNFLPHITPSNFLALHKFMRESKALFLLRLAFIPEHKDVQRKGSAPSLWPIIKYLSRYRYIIVYLLSLLSGAELKSFCSEPHERIPRFRRCVTNKFSSSAFENWRIRISLIRYTLYIVSY